MSSANIDSKRPAHELHALLRNADDITRSAATITTECRRFMAHLQKVLAGPDAQVLRQEMGEALARLLGAFDGYAAAVAKHSVSFAVAVDDAAGWVEVVKASCAAAVGGSEGGESVCGSREGKDVRLSPPSSSSSASGRTVIRTTRPMRTFSVDSTNAHGSPSFSPAKSPGSRAPVPPIHTTPPFRSPLAVQPASPPVPSRTVSSDPQPQPQFQFQAPVFSADDSGGVSALQEAFGQAGVSDTQTRPSPTLSPSPSPPKSAFTFRAPSPPAAASQCASATISRSSSTTARTLSPAGATYSLSSSSSASTSRTCSPFSPSSPSPSSTTSASASPSSCTTPSLHTAERAYSVVARGVNVHGNRWERRAYGPGSPNCTSFHYSNADGSNYSSLPDGSERFESARGKVFLRVAVGKGKGEGGERVGGWRRCTGPSAVGGGGCGGGQSV